MQSYWFGDVDEYGCRPAPKGLSSLASRLESLHVVYGRFVPFEWNPSGMCGFGWTRKEYITRLRQLCFFLAEREIVRQYGARDAELLQMIRTLDELDEATNMLTERVVEWHRVKNPGFSRKYKRLSREKLLLMLKKDEGPAFQQIIGEIESISKARGILSAEVSRRAEEVIPNCSALVGGLVAARLISHSGGLPALARLPGSAIQVLGSHTALYSHIRGGTPSPKHGIIFQHRRVHNAPKETRGRVARVLASKLAIAARIDYYRQEPDQDFIVQAQSAVDRAGDLHDMDR
ncbi:MAG TPA: RNA-processing protein [Methanoregulaceae archaeon]|nr:RNA-processing protein [Methanoregulaceae archaeon]